MWIILSKIGLEDEIAGGDIKLTEASEGFSL